jgi:hypothetical protein
MASILGLCCGLLQPMGWNMQLMLVWCQTAVVLASSGLPCTSSLPPRVLPRHTHTLTISMRRPNRTSTGSRLPRRATQRSLQHIITQHQRNRRLRGRQRWGGAGGWFSESYCCSTDVSLGGRLLGQGGPFPVAAASTRHLLRTGYTGLPPQGRVCLWFQVLLMSVPTCCHLPWEAWPKQKGIWRGSDLLQHPNPLTTG